MPIEATPVVEAHVDEELLTREKYFRDKLAEQTERVKAEFRSETSQWEAEQHRKELGVGAALESRLGELEADYSRRQATLKAQAADKISKANKRLEAKQAEWQQEERRAEAFCRTQREHRQMAELEASNPKLARAQHHELELHRMGEVARLERELEAELQRARDRHASELASGAGFLHAHKPVLVGALVGGAVGLLLTPL